MSVEKSNTSGAFARDVAHARTLDRSPRDAKGPFPHPMGLTRTPGPDSWEGLPPGPRMLGPLQLAAYYLRWGDFLERCHKRYGSPFTLRFRFPAVPWVVVSDADQVKALFRAPADVLWAGDGSSELHKVFGSPALAYFEEDEHLHRRKQLNRSLHGKAIEQLSESIEAAMDLELSSWPRGERVELFPRLRRLAVEIICRASFGPQPDERVDRLIDVYNDALYPTYYDPLAMSEDHYLPPIGVRLLRLHRPYRRLVSARARVDEILSDLIEDRRVTQNGDGRLDTVSVLLAATNEDGTPLSSAEIRNEIATNLLAGTASTAAAMAWSIERLSRQPAARQRLITEIDAGEDDAYLTATVREVLRWKPPLPQIIPRLVRKPFDLDGYRMAPGVRLVATPRLLHHDPSVYPDPDVFRPERFLGDQPDMNYAWIPFGGGRRRCAGSRIAEHELRVFLRSFFLRFDVRPDRAKGEGERPLLAAVRPSRNCRVVLSERRPTSL
jgi:cytochrome P450